jgi:hypothetical protein
MRPGAFLYTRKHFVLAFGESIHIVYEIDQQEFPVELLGKSWLDAKVERPTTKREQPVPL